MLYMLTSMTLANRVVMASPCVSDPHLLACASIQDCNELLWQDDISCLFTDLYGLCTANVDLYSMIVQNVPLWNTMISKVLLDKTSPGLQLCSTWGWDDVAAMLAGGIPSAADGQQPY